MGHTGAYPPELYRKLSPYLRDTLRDVKEKLAKQAAWRKSCEWQMQREHVRIC